MVYSLGNILKDDIERDEILYVLLNDFSGFERAILFLVPEGNKQIINLLAQSVGIGEAAIKARYKKLIMKLRRHLRAGEFEKYKKITKM